MYDEFFPATTPSGRPVPRGPEITMSSDVLHLIARGDVVHPTVASFLTYHRHPEVTYVPLRGLPAVESGTGLGDRSGERRHPSVRGRDQRDRGQ
jgi:hypothetical protein